MALSLLAKLYENKSKIKQIIVFFFLPFFNKRAAPFWNRPLILKAKCLNLT